MKQCIYIDIGRSYYTDKASVKKASSDTLLNGFEIDIYIYYIYIHRYIYINMNIGI